MSSPPAETAGETPVPGWYPDPSIPGYIRYWSGASWVPGSSRPEPRGGEPMPAPPMVAPPVPPVVPDEPASEETGPVFFDEEPEPRPASSSSALPELRMRGEVAPAGWSAG
jgi:hypothetical protein